MTIPLSAPGPDLQSTATDAPFRRRQRMLRIRYLIFLLLLVAACGKRGAPSAPVLVVPRAVSDLSAAQRGGRVVLTWSFPSTTNTGQSLTSVRRMVVYRLREELPGSLFGRDVAALRPGEADPAVPDEIELFELVPMIAPEQYVRLRERLAVLESSQFPEHTVGAQVIYEDEPAVATPDGRPIRFTYAVVTEGPQGESDLSNLAAIVPLDAPVPPPRLVIDLEQDAVVLRWEESKRGLSGAEIAELAGYNIYRFPASGSFFVLGNPVNAEPVRGTTFRDSPPYGSYRYAVTAVRAVGPPRLESLPTPTVLADFRDRQPPPAPTEVAALAEERAIRLIWNAVAAPDLRGYLVYRFDGRKVTRLTPVPVDAAFFSDESITRGVTYFYSVSSIDLSGNESARTNSEAVLVPVR